MTTTTMAPAYYDIAMLAKDYGWTRTQRFNNMNGDRCIRARWQKGAGKKESVLYIAVNVDSGDVVEVRTIVGNREVESNCDFDHVAEFLRK